VPSHALNEPAEYHYPRPAGHGSPTNRVGRLDDLAPHGLSADQRMTLSLQRLAGNRAVTSVASGGDVTVQRQGRPGTLPVPDRPAGVLPRKTIHEESPLPDLSQTPRGAGFSAAQAILDGARKQLDRVALAEEREKAITALMGKHVEVYDILRMHPGKGLAINVNFKSEDPKTQPIRPAEYKPQLDVLFLDVTVSDPFEIPDATEGPAVTPAAAGPGDVGFGWKGNMLTLTVNPVLPDPKKLKASHVVDSVEALLSHMTNNFMPAAKVAGQLKRGQPVEPPAGIPAQGPVIEVVVFGTKLLVLESVARATADALGKIAREELGSEIGRSKKEIIRLQALVDQAAGEGSVSRWWNDRSFDLDPHILDSPRAHLSAAENYLGTDDLDNAYESYAACEDTLGIVRNELYAYETNDFSDPAMQDPLNVGVPF
jgi:hypothetical protein